jgi:N-acetylneuraminic acid mutarotase
MKSIRSSLSPGRVDKSGPVRILRFSRPEVEIEAITHRERRKKVSLPRVNTTARSLQKSTDWAEKSLKAFERTHHLHSKSSNDELVSVFKASLKEQYSIVRPTLDKNVQRLNMTYSKHDSYPLQPFLADLIPPKQSLMERDSVLIDRHYPNPSYSRAANRLVFPGDYEYSMKRSEQLVKSQQSLLHMGQTVEVRRKSKVKDEDEEEEEEEEENDEEFIINLMKKQYETRALSKDKEDLLTGLNLCWSQRQILSQRPESREGASLLFVNNRFYLFAGQGKDKRNDVRVLNPDTWQWSLMKTAYTPKGRIGHTACVYKNKIVVFGGWANYSQRLGLRRCFRKVYVLRLIQGSWFSRIGSGKVPKPRRCHMAAVLGHSLVIFGGLDSMSKRLQSTYVYDLKQHSWLKVPSSPPTGGRSNATFTAVYPPSILGRSDFSVMSPPKLRAELAQSGSGFYLFGGLDDTDRPTNAMSLLEMRNESLVWSEVAQSGTVPLARYDHCAVCLQGRLIICGGRNDSLYASQGDSCLNDVHVFKLESMSWEEVTIHGTVPTGRWGHSCVGFGSKVLMMCGINHHLYLPTDVFVLETDQSYVSELVRQLAEEETQRRSAALKQAVSLMLMGQKGRG